MAVFAEKRHDRRIPVSERGLLTNQDDVNEVIPVMITDVSYSGVGFLSEKMFQNIRFSKIRAHFQLVLFLLRIKIPENVI